MEFIECKNCKNKSSVPGKKSSEKCDVCNINYWGYSSLLELPIPDRKKVHLFNQLPNLSQEESRWVSQLRRKHLGFGDQANSQPNKHKPYESDQTIIDKNESLGWLIVKTEGVDDRSYPLLQGTNTIGRNTHAYTPNISLEEDRHVSRYHLTLFIESNDSGKYHFYIVDGSDNEFKRPSLNGTYINGSGSRIVPDQKVEIRDGDTIQIGLTKLVFKSALTGKSEEELKTEVHNQSYTQTIPASKFNKIRK